MSLFLTIMNYFSTLEMALELYHLPGYVMLTLALNIPWLRHRLTDEALRPPSGARPSTLLGLEDSQPGARQPQLPLTRLRHIYNLQH